MVSTQIEQARKAALSVIRGVVLPRVSQKLLSELNNADSSEFRLLGKVVGQHERVLEASFSGISNPAELEQLRHIYCEEELEHSIRAKYAVERLKNLKPVVDNITRKLAKIENELSRIDHIAQETRVLPDVIADTIQRFGISPHNQCTEMPKSEGELT